MALSFRRRFAEIGARYLLMALGDDGRASAQTTCVLHFSLCGASLPAYAYLKFLSIYK